MAATAALLRALGDAARVAARLLADDMFSGWGIRTLSSASIAYNPISYHLGSVWPHDNGLIAAGFCRYDQNAAALRVFDALYEAATAFRHYRLPELYAGYARSDSEARPVSYPVACSPQAWAAISPSPPQPDQPSRSSRSARRKARRIWRFSVRGGVVGPPRSTIL